MGDEASKVAANRSLLARVLRVRPVFLSQVHGTEVLRLSTGIADGLKADASLTTQPGLACTVMVADCLPVLLTDARGTVVASAHAGWRGLAGQNGEGVLERTIERLRASAPGGSSSDLLAWLGPCIGPLTFEVGGEVRDAFLSQDAAAETLFKPGSAGKWMADLPALARLRLRRAGVDRIYGNDGSSRWCTVSNSSRYFSYRRDRVSGRMAACVWLD